MHTQSMRAVVYTRASLDRTGEGKSNERQREECQRLCSYKGWETVGVEEDFSISAYGDKVRPAWNRVLDLVKAGRVDVVVAWHLDRLTRNMADLETLILLCEKHNVSIATATGDLDLTTDTGRMIARILAAVARQEVERKAARQRLAHAQRRNEGRPWEAVKILGYERTGEIIEEEAAAIREGAEVLLSGGTMASVGRMWAGIESPYRQDKDKPWTSSGVRAVMLNPRIAGYICEPDGTVVGKGNWDPILEDQTFASVCTKILDNPHAGNKGGAGRRPESLLTNIAVCGACGGRIKAATMRSGKKKTYACADCSSGRVDRDEADALVRSAFALTIAAVGVGAVLPVSQQSADPASLDDDIEALTEREKLITAMFIEGKMTPAGYREAQEQIAASLKGLQGQIEARGRTRDAFEIRADQVSDFLAMSGPEQKRALEKHAIVTILPANGQRISVKAQVDVAIKGVRGLIPAHRAGNGEEPPAPKG